MNIYGISRERDLKLQEIAKRPPTEPPNQKMLELAHKIADDKEHGRKINRRELGKLRKMMDDPTNLGTGWEPVFLQNELEAERLKFHRVRLGGLAAGEEIKRMKQEIELTRLERDAAEKRERDTYRKNLVVSIEDASKELHVPLDELDPDLIQIINLRGRKLSWADVALTFRRDGKGRKRYNREGVRQIYEDAKKKNLGMVKALEGVFAKKKAERRTVQPERTDLEEIKAMTTQSRMDTEDLFGSEDVKRGFDMADGGPIPKKLAGKRGGAEY